ncbi:MULTISPECIES: carbohydrate ABC transporter permease [unclassified Devosia]|uniref:carbohydrate ABC transporter permease n=1 Tax=unclassified Devosia TaxID=196773 RepID=UPI0025C2738C|nr:MULTISPECIES: carbohydrate ABC transporter permease [unclassified Devosia]
MDKDPFHIKVIRYSVILVMTIWSAVPVYFAVASSFKPPRDIFSVPPTFIFQPTLESYEQLFTLWPTFTDAMLNSLVIAVGTTLLTVVSASLAGYVFSRYQSRVLSGAAIFTLLIRMLPPIIITLPLFPVVNALRLNDTHILLIVIYATFQLSFATWIMKAFIDAVPKELEEAALIDGAGTASILLRVIMPLAVHGMIVAATFAFIASWNEFLFAYVFSSTRARTAPLILSQMLATESNVEWGVLFAGTSIQLIPVIVLVLALQRFIIAGLTAGGVKG